MNLYILQFQIVQLSNSAVFVTPVIEGRPITHESVDRLPKDTILMINIA